MHCNVYRTVLLTTQINQKCGTESLNWNLVPFTVPFDSVIFFLNYHGVFFDYHSNTKVHTYAQYPQYIMFYYYFNYLHVYVHII